MQEPTEVGVARHPFRRPERLVTDLEVDDVSLADAEAAEGLDEIAAAPAAHARSTLRILNEAR